MDLGKQQGEAVDAVYEWFHNSNEQVFRLMGYAGTGKTTLAKVFENLLHDDNPKLKTQYAAFTGKAAHVLRQKGCRAQTIHSLTYHLVDSPGRKPIFELNKKDSPLLYTDLLVLDEVSMVNEEVGRDLCSFPCKILVLGDPAQLPPVEGEGYFTKARADYLLTEIHRQAEGSPIIRLATELRNGRMPLAGTYGDSEVRYGISEELVMGTDQLIVGTNRIRRGCNERFRSLKGFMGNLLGDERYLPKPGDRLICLRNNRFEGLLNGMQFEVLRTNTEYMGDPDDFFPQAYVCDLKSEDGEEFNGIQMHKNHFTGSEIPLFDLVKANEFDYAYAVTCHKAQGSQWPDVVVHDESDVFRDKKWNWLYTAVTRAVKRVHICKR